MDEIILGIIDIIKKHMISRTNLRADASIGDTIINIDNAFHFKKKNEIVLIDSGYNDANSPRYGQLEYARIKNIINTRQIELFEPLEGDWLASQDAFIQKTIGHSPLYENRIYYGDREVISTHEMAITVDPTTADNEWMYIARGQGLKEQFNVNITVYGKAFGTEEGTRTTVKYADALKKLFTENLHLDIDSVEAPLEADLEAGEDTLVIEDTPRNREYFYINNPNEECTLYTVQSNQGKEMNYFDIIDIEYVDINGPKMILKFNRPVEFDFPMNEFSHIRNHGRYLYDSRTSSINYGVTQKGSAILRAAQLTWFGNEVQTCCNRNELNCTTPSHGVDCFTERE